MGQRGRAYLTSNDPEGVFITGPEGNKYVAAYGCPCFSLGEPYYTESLLPKGYKTVVDWLQGVAIRGEGYENPEFSRLDDEEIEEDIPAWEHGNEGDSNAWIPTE